MFDESMNAITPHAPRKNAPNGCTSEPEGRDHGADTAAQPVTQAALWLLAECTAGWTAGSTPGSEKTLSFPTVVLSVINNTRRAFH